MKNKFNFGLILSLLVSLITIFIWFIVRSGTPTFETYSSFTHSFGQLFGLIGVALFSLSLLFMTRFKFLENLFGGLDKMYEYHHKFGIISFILILFHPILLVLKFVPSNFKLAAKYLLPSGAWSVNFGIIALGIMILLIVLTMFIYLKYQKWKFSHKFLGLVYMLTLLHIFLVTTDISRYLALKVYMIILSIMGIISFIYSIFIRPNVNQYSYELSNLEIRNKVILLKMRPLGKKLNFKSGQFVFIRIKDKSFSKEQHPFSIVSSPQEEEITLGIKQSGDYTYSLSDLKMGTKIDLEGSYGGFWNLEAKKNKLIIAGGIGITPFISILSSLKHSEKVDLYYCTSTKSEMVFLKELKKIIILNKNIKLIEWNSDEKGRINFSIINKLTTDLDKKDILICGPSSLTNSLYKDFKKNKIKVKNIYFENFNIK